MSEEKSTPIKGWINEYSGKIYQRDIFIAIFSIIFGLILSDVYSYVSEYLVSPEIKVAYSLWGKKAQTKNTPDSTSVLTYINDDVENCVAYSIEYKAPRGTISSNLKPAHYAGFIISNVGNARANNIQVYFNLEFPGDSFSLDKTYSTRASISNTEAPLIGQKGQLVKIDHIDPNSFEIVVVGRIDSTSTGNYEEGHQKNTFTFYSLNYNEINEPTRQKVDQVSFYQVRRAIKYKAYSSDFKTISAPFETHNPKGKTDVSATTGVTNTCVKSLPDNPWFEESNFLFW